MNPTSASDRIFFGGISVYLEQHWALFRKTPWLLDRLWDSNFALKAAAKRTIPVDPHFLGAMTVSMLEVENGHLKKEVREDARSGCARSRVRIVINLPYTLLIGLAEPLKKRAGCAGVLHAARRGSVPRRPARSRTESRALDLIRQNIPHVDCFLAVSDYYAEFHVPIPGNSGAQDGDRASRRQHGGLS